MGGFIQRLARRFHPNFVASDSWQRACPVAAGYNRKMCESCWGAESRQGRTETSKRQKWWVWKSPRFFCSSWLLWNGEYVITSWILGSWSAAFIWPWWNFKPIRIRIVLRKKWRCGDKSWKWKINVSSVLFIEFWLTPCQCWIARERLSRNYLGCMGKY